ncbi:ferric-chelate reductase [Paraphoma chrysanthemicola]|nr:ferric-chelate reductase [Paraphoma chrysanthemicola]
MSHSGHSSMGSMAMPALGEFPKFYWAVVGSAIGVATLVNLYNHVLCRQRLSAARAGSLSPAKPRSWFALGNATIYALTREASNFSLHIPLKNWTLRLPSVGRTSLVLANAVTLIVLCLYGLDLTGRFTKEDVAFRCGVVTVAQLPLIFLLAGKNNIIGYLSGVSYERLNWLHRWCARTMLLTATIHMGYFFTSWARYNYIGWKIKNDNISWKGLTAWSILVWIVFSSMAPIRGWSYEVFVIQHLVSFAVFIGFVYIHVPADFKVYVWIPVALFFLDRTLRAARVLYANISFFHPKLRTQGHAQGVLACKAVFTPLSNNTTRVVIQTPPINWTPGQHVFLSCHSIVPLQSHPFTVASIPEDGRMEFLIKSESGGTRRFFRHAEKSHKLPEEAQRSRSVLIEGPYGCLRPLRQFDSVVLLAGSTGATFTTPLLRDIIQGWKERTDIPIERDGLSLHSRKVGAATRNVRFVWVIKSRGQVDWFSQQLSTVATEFHRLQETLKDIKLELTVYVTCDESFTEEHKSLLAAITAPNHEQPLQKQLLHGPVEYRGRPQSTRQEGTQDEKKLREATTDVLQDLEGEKACGPDGTCCCRTAVDETSPDNIDRCCCCTSNKVSGSTPTSRPTSRISSTPSSTAKPRLLIHPSIKVYSGRPKTRDIIRRSLEQALGESAVVVCGPQGLVSDVKQDVCALSDERAVHKGTDAQGIYLHTESFSY